jgi:ABC-type Fe3+/spermidine/putrescine transport system ATPase subunit
MSNTILECKKLNKVYDTDKALIDFDYKFTKGKFYCVIGPSGAGKTTLLKIIANIVAPDSGEVLHDNQKIGLVFQDLALFPHMTVAQNIAFGINSTDKDKILKKYLKFTGLDLFAHKYPSEISGGQQQRVAIARILAAGMDIVLLDEPFANLDKNFRNTLSSEIKLILQQAGVTTILVTHSQEEALALADEILLLENGKLVQSGSPEDIYSKPISICAAKLLGDTNFFLGVIQDNVVETPIGKLNYDKLQNSYKNGAKVIAMIRPEQFIIDNSSKSNIKFPIVEKRYYGHDTDIFVQVEHKQKVKIRVLGRCNLKVGDNVSIDIVGNAVVFHTK